MSKTVTDFIFNGKGTITLQLANLVFLIVASWNLATWKVNLENKIEESTKYRWTSIDMSGWSHTLALSNPTMEVPKVIVTYEAN